MSNYYHIYKSTDIIPKNIKHKFCANEFPMCSMSEELRILENYPVLDNEYYISIEDNKNCYVDELTKLTTLNINYICPECLSKLEME